MACGGKQATPSDDSPLYCCRDPHVDVLTACRSECQAWQFGPNQQGNSAGSICSTPLHCGLQVQLQHLTEAHVWLNMEVSRPKLTSGRLGLVQLLLGTTCAPL